MEEQILRIQQKLLSRGYHMNDSWLSDCLDYYLNENPNADDDETLTFVTAQWQLSDLREISNEKGCLPVNLIQQKFTKLTGKYILQVEKGYDISTSKYKQLEAMRKVSNENISITNEENSQPWEIKPNRMMELFLTDGVQSISAIEYKPIKFLKDIILPGFKILIKGPVVCRKGVILLEQSNLVEIGGEVENLLIKNATENVFARALKMPENPDPYNDKSKPDSLDPTDLFDDNFEVDFDEVTQLESANKNQSFNEQQQPPRNQPPTPKSHSSVTKSRFNTRNLMTPVDRTSSKSELPVCFERIPEVNDELMEIDDLEFPDDDELNALLEQSNPENSGNQMKNQSNFQTRKNDEFSEIPENRRKMKNSGKTRENLSENPGKTLENHWKMENSSENPGKTLENSRKMENSSENPGKTSENIIVISDDEAALPEKPRENISPRFECDEFDEEFDWDPLETETLVIKENSLTPISKSPVVEKTTPKNLTPISKATPTASPLARSSKQKKIGKPEENTRKIIDYFKKSDSHKKSDEKLNLQIKKICDFICEIKENEKSGGKLMKKKFCIKVKKLQQLTKEDTGWLLKGTVTDSTGDLDVKFASEVLDKQFGFTAAEFSQKKKEGKKNKELMEKLRKTFREAEQRLSKLDGIVVIELGGEIPRVVEVEEIDEGRREEVRRLKRQLGY